MKAKLLNVIKIIVVIFLISPSLLFAISAEDLNQSLYQSDKFTLIDIRSNSSYKYAHIPGAINISAKLCSGKKLPGIDRVIIYGDGIDKQITNNALKALSKISKNSIEILEGGFSRWEALNFPTTLNGGLVKKFHKYISYKKLKKIASNNQELVLIDLRDKNSNNKTSIKSELTDLSARFPGTRIVSHELKTKNLKKRQKYFPIPETISEDKSHLNLYVLIDNGNEDSLIMAKRLKASGIKRFLILAGGEESIIRNGQSELITK